MLLRLWSQNDLIQGNKDVSNDASDSICRILLLRIFDHGGEQKIRSATTSLAEGTETGLICYVRKTSSLLLGGTRCEYE